MLAAMEISEIRLQLAGEDPPRGRLVDDRGVATEFAGWLDLMGALETLLGGAVTPEPPAASSEGKSAMP